MCATRNIECDIYKSVDCGECDTYSLLLFMDPFYWHDIHIIPKWLSNHMSSKVWNEITYPIPSFNGLVMDK